MITEFLLAATLQSDFQILASKSDDRIGICALDIATEKPVCVNGEQRFSLQSVMKLFVAAAVLDAVDRKELKLSDIIVVRPEDASPGPQDFANLVRKRGELRTTIEELMRMAVNESDSTSADILIARVGGPAGVQEFFRRKKIENIRVDRNERHLQAENKGLAWQIEYADEKKFDAAVKGVATEKRDKAWLAYLKDPRDTASPEAMVLFLKALVSGKLLSESSTTKLLDILAATKTGSDRLRAGIPKDWKLGNKTGTSGSWKGIEAATNDVGILTAPNGGKIAVAVFVADSKRPKDQRAAVIASTARLVTASYQIKK